ncbi:MAG: FitA-like ribbon-helix-helix domain-containing protein [Planctomycetota bacterium]|jgi:plasmid stability protein
MAQLIVRNLEDDIRDRLRAMAAEHGRSMEEEVREILRAAVLRASIDSGANLGSRIAERFRDCGLDEEIRELRGQPAKPADFES